MANDLTLEAFARDAWLVHSPPRCQRPLERRPCRDPRDLAADVLGGLLGGGPTSSGMRDGRQPASDSSTRPPPVVPRLCTCSSHAANHFWPLMAAASA